MEKNNSECVFCKIVKGEIPCHKIWEDKKHLAFLDINPNTEGMALVIPKEHFDSDVFELSDYNLRKLFVVTKQVVKILEKRLKVKRVAMVCEGMGIDHLHVKLYPMHGLKNKFQEIWGGKIKYFQKYPGYVTTELGPKKTKRELAKTAKKIRGE